MPLHGVMDWWIVLMGICIVLMVFFIVLYALVACTPGRRLRATVVDPRRRTVVVGHHRLTVVVARRRLPTAAKFPCISFTRLSQCAALGMNALDF
jgi:hypothetical protein